MKTATSAACLAVAFVFGVALLSIAAGPRRLTLVVPGVGSAPASVRVRVIVEPDADNRLLEVEASSDVYYRSSAVQIDGAAGPRTSFLEWRDLPAGRYAVTATLRSSSRVVAREIRTFLVVGFDGP